ncbi:MAG TPA: hypothetical protein VF230_18625 [Acidimicrobiales bacterium]
MTPTESNDASVTESGRRRWLWWLFPAALAVAGGLFALSTIGGSTTKTPAADAHDAAGERPPETEVQCGADGKSRRGIFDYVITNDNPGPQETRDAVAGGLRSKLLQLHATVDEFVPGHRSADRAEEVLVRDGRVVAVVDLKHEGRTGWHIAGLKVCESVLADA